MAVSEPNRSTVAHSRCAQYVIDAYREARLAGKLASLCIDLAIIIQYVDAVQVVAFASGIIIGVMGGGDLDSTSTKAHVHQLSVLDDGHLPPIQGVYHKLALQMLVPVSCHCFQQHATYHQLSSLWPTSISYSCWSLEQDGRYQAYMVKARNHNSAAAK